MKEVFRAILEAVDSRLKQYFLCRGGRLKAIPLNKQEYYEMLNKGYEPIVAIEYEELSRDILVAINEIFGSFGDKELLFFPTAIVAIISHEASRVGSALYNALHAAPRDTDSQKKEGGRQKRKRE